MTLNYESHGNRRDFLRSIYSTISQVEGNVVECGVQYGFSLGWLAHLIYEEGKGRTLYGFDVWEGDPPLLYGESVPSVSWDSAQLPVWTALSASFLPGSQVKLIKGEFRNTLPKVKTEPLAFLHVDCDIYQSYYDVLSILWPRITTKGVVVLDEYGTGKWPGATKATDTFLETLPSTNYELVKDTRWYIRRLA